MDRIDRNLISIAAALVIFGGVMHYFAPHDSMYEFICFTALGALFSKSSYVMGRNGYHEIPPDCVTITETSAEPPVDSP